MNIYTDREKLSQEAIATALICKYYKEVYPPPNYRLTISDLMWAFPRVVVGNKKNIAKIFDEMEKCKILFRVSGDEYDLNPAAFARNKAVKLRKLTNPVQILVRTLDGFSAKFAGENLVIYSGDKAKLYTLVKHYTIAEISVYAPEFFTAKKYKTGKDTVISLFCDYVHFKKRKEKKIKCPECDRTFTHSHCFTCGSIEHSTLMCPEAEG